MHNLDFSIYLFWPIYRLTIIEKYLSMSQYTGNSNSLNWQSILDFLPDAAIIVNEQYIITHANFLVTGLLGHPKDVICGRDFYALFPDCDTCCGRLDEQKFCITGPVVAGQVSQPLVKIGSCQVSVVTASGERLPVLLSTREIDSVSIADVASVLVVIKDVSEMHHVETRLEEERSRFELILNSTSDAVFLAPISKDGVHGNFVEVNKTACERLGYSKEELLQLNARSINPKANLTKIKAFGRGIQREKETIFDAIHQAKNGEQIPVEVVAKVIQIDKQDFVLSVVRDLRHSKNLENIESRFGRLMEHAWDEIYVFTSSECQLVQVNYSVLNNLGYTNTEILEKTFLELNPELSNEGFHEIVKPLFSGEESQVSFESSILRKDGSLYPVEVRLQLSHSEVPAVFLANVHDISQRKKMEKRLTYLATYDSLTGLANRTLFIERLKAEMDSCKRNNVLTAVLFIDLDGFKSVNDSFGHDVGDKLLQGVAHRFRRIVRSSDTIARMGGDEFTFIITNLKCISGLDIVLEKIKSAFSLAFEVDQRVINITPSIGASVYPFGDEDDPYSILKQADTAMYHAKKEGKNNHSLYTAVIAEGEYLEARINQDSRIALEKNEFSLFMQPRVNMQTGQIVAAEALIRWIHPELGFIPPTDFIPVIEKNGMIHEIGDWVLSTALDFLKQAQLLNESFKVSINISIKQFERPDFVEKISAAIQDARIRSSDVELEITEGLLISNQKQAIDVLNALKARDILVSLDDFGTGYSSLSYLKEFPIDIIKIDRSFIQDLEKNKEGFEIVKAVVNLAHTLGRSVVAEGIETAAHYECLKSIGCEEGQGYYMEKPIPIDAFLNLLSSRRSI